MQINPHYKSETTVQKLVEEDLLEPGCAEIFQINGQPLRLYKYQEYAISCARSKESYVVTSGTGSGKSLTFFIPIVNHILAAKKRDPESRRTRAIVIYPMNALANSQQ